MTKERKIRLVAAISLAALIFIVGVMIGQIGVELRSGEFSAIGRNLRIYLLGIETQTQLAEKFLCEIDILELTKERYVLGRNLEFLEQRLGKGNKEVLEMKKEYSLILIRQLLLMEKFKEKCKTPLNIIIFFYSNNETYLDISVRQGYILYHLYLKYPRSVITYPFDVDLGIASIDVLRRIYNITEIPSLVINGKLYEGFVNKEVIESSLIT